MGAFDKKRYHEPKSMAGIKPPASSSGSDSGSSGSGSSTSGGFSGLMDSFGKFFSPSPSKPFVMGEGTFTGKSMAGVAGTSALSLAKIVSFITGIFKGMFEMIGEMFQNFAKELGFEKLAESKNPPAAPPIEKTLLDHSGRLDSLEKATGTASSANPFLAPKKQVAH